MPHPSREDIQARFKHLIETGARLVEQKTLASYVGDSLHTDALAWVYSAVHLLEKVLPDSNIHRTEAVRLRPSAKAEISWNTMSSLFGLLKSAAEEYSLGLTHSFELQYFGIVFEDFLALARRSTAAGRLSEAAVLASAVLEDVVQKLLELHGQTQSENDTVLERIRALKRKSVISKIKAGRLESFVTIRNGAFHANLTDANIDRKDVQQMIDCLEELIKTHLLGEAEGN